MSRILIVEDDPANLCGLKDNLEFESHHVLTAADGEAGYRTLCEHSPDLVILDLMLPKLSGYDLCKRLRGEGFNAPILMLSARSQEGDRVLGLDLGANDYVSKPFSLRELLARVRALLRHEEEHRLDESRLNRELEMAAKVQQELFPRVLSKVPGLDYAGACKPASGVSGDYYDFIPFGEGRLGMLLADVSGKGAEARLRLARKPKWRIFTNPDTRRCNRNRRRNSIASSVMDFIGLPVLESRQRNGTRPLTSDNKRLLEIATRCV